MIMEVNNKENKFDFFVWNPEDKSIIPQFIEVLKAAHAEPLTSNKDIFLWKHKNNPSGPSLLTYAVDKWTSKVVAIQVMSLRDIVYNNKSYIGYESNDTSTHPSYFRQGLFGSLLKLCMETANSRGGGYVYGLPNINSKRGFEKAGWKNVGEIEIIAKFCSPFKAGYSLLKYGRSGNVFVPNPKISEPTSQIKKKLPENIEEIISARNSWTDMWSSEKSREFLEWRFLDHPLRDYEIVKTKDGVGFVTIGKRGFLKEIRVVDICFNERFSKRSAKEFVGVIRERFSPDIITTIFSTGHPYHDGFCRAGFHRLPSDIMFFNYAFSNCPVDLIGKPWSITGVDVDTQ